MDTHAHTPPLTKLQVHVARLRGRTSSRLLEFGGATHQALRAVPPGGKEWRERNHRRRGVIHEGIRGSGNDPRCTCNHRVTSGSTCVAGRQTLWTNPPEASPLAEGGEGGRGGNKQGRGLEPHCMGTGLE